MQIYYSSPNKTPNYSFILSIKDFKDIKVYKDYKDFFLIQSA